MKKLSEIGTERFVDFATYSSEINTNLHYVRCYFPDKNGESPTSDAHDKIIQYTEAERRELVRRVWVSSRNELAAEHANLGRALTFEEFLDNEGI
jgi:hypothetical protein